MFTDAQKFKVLWAKHLNTRKLRVYHYDETNKESFYKLNWGVSHSAFTLEPFGYSIFESVDFGKLPILHKSWCPELEYKYRVSSKKEFQDIYKEIQSDSYEERLVWFTKLKNYMVDNFTDKQKWVNSFLEIYNGG